MGQAGGILEKIQMDAQENFSQETIAKFESDPEFYRDFVKKVEVEVNNTFPIVSQPFAYVVKLVPLTRSARYSQTARSKPSPAPKSPNT